MLEIWYGQNALMACYLVEGTRRALIDTGTTDSPTQAIAPALAKLGRRIEDIDLVLNTHGHIDHAWGNGEFKRLAPHATTSSSSGISGGEASLVPELQEAGLVAQEDVGSVEGNGGVGGVTLEVGIAAVGQAVEGVEVLERRELAIGGARDGLRPVQPEVQVRSDGKHPADGG
ncbi:MAG: MBL fold metallo-hydrolase [Proteobacteria bacterium]|nr:MBL fold metallo-hydrolase [Pseudomonadota bacterium]